MKFTAHELAQQLEKENRSLQIAMVKNPQCVPALCTHIQLLAAHLRERAIEEAEIPSWLLEQAS